MKNEGAVQEAPAPASNSFLSPHADWSTPWIDEREVEIPVRSPEINATS